MSQSRRAALGAGLSLLATAALPRAAEAQWRMSERYPDPAIRIIDPSFARYRVALAAIMRLGTGWRWAEGPAWFGDHRTLLWSDPHDSRIYRWDEVTGEVSIFRAPSNNANGNTRDREGRLVTCEHLTRRVTRTERDGRITVLADRFDGKRFNSPNDVVVKSDGSIWFTDPPYGILAFTAGERAERELPTNVYRIDGQSGQVTVVADDVNFPNGLAFSPDESILYVVEDESNPKRIRAFDVAGATLRNSRVFYDCVPGETPDGFRVDVDGNLWCGWGMTEAFDGVRVFNRAGAAIGHIHLPERCANLCFGGRHRNRLFMPAGKSLYALYVNVQGVGYG
jgi:gluconolactonase